MYQLLMVHLQPNLPDSCSCLCCVLYSAEAAALGVSEPAGFGPEGVPGTEGGACTGDVTDLTCFPSLKTILAYSYSVNEVLFMRRQGVYVNHSLTYITNKGAVSDTKVIREWEVI